LESLWNASGEYENDGENVNAGEMEYVDPGDDIDEDVGEVEHVEDGVKGLYC
jgi:hypothetical protein